MTDKKLWYATECHGGCEADGAPAAAVFSIDLDTAKKILARANYIKENGLAQVTEFGFRVKWIKMILRKT